MVNLKAAFQARQQSGLHTGRKVVILHQPIVRLIGQDTDRTRLPAGQHVLVCGPHGRAFPLVSIINKIPFGTERFRIQVGL